MLWKLAEFLQHPLAQIHTAADAALGELDDLAGNDVGFALIAVLQAERTTNVGISPAQRADRFRLERLVPEQAIDGHRSALITVTDFDRAASKVAGGSAVLAHLRS